MGLISRVSSRTYRSKLPPQKKMSQEYEPETKKVKKSKKRKSEAPTEDSNEDNSEKVVISFEDQLKNVNSIAKPMVNKKLARRVYKSIAEAKAIKGTLCRGLKEVTKALKKKEKGFVVFAGDVMPIDIYCHLIPWCEQLNLPYCFTPSKQLLGA